MPPKASRPRRARRAQRAASAQRARNERGTREVGGSLFAARRVGVCWRWLWRKPRVCRAAGRCLLAVALASIGVSLMRAAPPSSAQRVCRVEPMFRAGAGPGSSGLHTRQPGRPTTRARGGGWGVSGLSYGLGGGAGRRVRRSARGAGASTW